ncbi:MAG: phosphatase PAP2 family protein [Marinilabiliales bacterium]|nr:MAG: phosphatase PAP2 family protein [Marinilabiliales bacterium]
MIDWLKQIDYNLLFLINGANNHLLDVIMIWISSIGIWVPLYILLLYFVVIKYKSKAWIAIPVFILAIGLSDLISVHLFKNVFERLRPCYEPELEGLIKNIVGCGGKFSFVSSHASNSFTIAFMSIFLMGDRHKWLKWLMPLWGLSIMYSRVYLGKHYPSDVIAGALLGILVSWLMYMLFTYILDYFSTKSIKI